MGWLLTSTELYDPDTNQWTQSGDMLEARLMVNPVLLPNGQVLIVAGNNGAAWGKAETYNPQTGTWSAVPDMPFIRLLNTVTLSMPVQAARRPEGIPARQASAIRINFIP